MSESDHDGLLTAGEKDGTDDTTDVAVESGAVGTADVSPGHRSGFVCLAGRPNVGKSTLLNAMLGAKLAIVTTVPGTTRDVIRGVVTRDDLQLVFVDTPGIIKPRRLLNARLNETAAQTWTGVDTVCLVVDAAEGIGPGDRYIADRLAGLDGPVICVVNKQDRVSRDGLLPILAEADELGDFAEIVPTSATAGTNVAHLVEVLADYVPEGPRLFPADTFSDQPRRQLISEVIREKFLTRVFDEVPHSLAVVIDAVEDQPGDAAGAAEGTDVDADGPTGEPEGGRPPDSAGLLEVYATIFVERDSQKGIVIGRGGRLIKAANTEARRELEEIFAVKVYLDVEVKVAPEWQDDPKHLERFGY